MFGFIGRAINEGDESNVDIVDEAGFDGLDQLGTKWGIVVEDVDDNDRWKWKGSGKQGTKHSREPRTYA